MKKPDFKAALATSTSNEESKAKRGTSVQDRLRVAAALEGDVDAAPAAPAPVEPPPPPTPAPARKTARTSAPPVETARPIVKRDMVSLTGEDVNRIRQLNKRAIMLDVDKTSLSGLVRAGLRALEALPDKTFLELVNEVGYFKPGPAPKKRAN